MTHYLLAVHSVAGEPEPSPDDMQAAYQRVDALNEELKAAGAWVFAGGLHPADQAGVVRSEDGRVVTTDGPFAEAKEQLAGFWLIEAADRDTALDWAGRASAACGGPVEVRAFQEIGEG